MIDLLMPRLSPPGRCPCLLAQEGARDKAAHSGECWPTCSRELKGEDSVDFDVTQTSRRFDLLALRDGVGGRSDQLPAGFEGHSYPQLCGLETRLGSSPNFHASLAVPRET